MYVCLYRNAFCVCFSVAGYGSDVTGVPDYRGGVRVQEERGEGTCNQVTVPYIRPLNTTGRTYFLLLKKSVAESFDLKSTNGRPVRHDLPGVCSLLGGNATLTQFSFLKTFFFICHFFFLTYI